MHNYVATIQFEGVLKVGKHCSFLGAPLTFPILILRRGRRWESQPKNMNPIQTVLVRARATIISTVRVATHYLSLLLTLS